MGFVGCVLVTQFSTNGRIKIWRVTQRRVMLGMTMMMNRTLLFVRILGVKSTYYYVAGRGPGGRDQVGSRVGVGRLNYI